MRQVVIENPILNSPYEAPQRHFRFDNEGITDDVADERRPSAYHGGFGRWAFVEVTDPWDAKNTIRAALGEAGARDYHLRAESA